MFFRKKKIEKKTYDKENLKPVIRCSICTGEQTAGFQDIRTGEFHAVCLIVKPEDLENFKAMYGTGDPEKIY